MVIVVVVCDVNCAISYTGMNLTTYSSA